MDRRSRAEMPIELVLNQLENVRESGAGWLALCPAHDDHNPSLKIDEDEDGRVLLHCFAGCDVGEITTALDIELKDLFHDKRLNSKPKARRSNKKNLIRKYREFEDRAFVALIVLREHIEFVLGHYRLDISGAYLKLAHKMPFIEHYINILITGSEEDRIKLLDDNDYRRLIEIGIRLQAQRK